MALLNAEETYQILGACFEVYKELGCGFLESVYQACLRIEFEERGIPMRERPPLAITYKGRVLTKKCVPDFLCFDSVVVELKAVSQLCDEHRAQVHNYLKVTGYRIALLVNFGHYPKVEYERIIR